MSADTKLPVSQLSVQIQLQRHFVALTVPGEKQDSFTVQLYGFHCHRYSTWEHV